MLALACTCLVGCPAPKPYHDTGPRDLPASAQDGQPVISCKAKANGVVCSGGRCQNETCCMGCIAGGLCRPGSTTSYCGTGGVSCSICKPSTCASAVCSGGYCGKDKVADGTQCMQGQGKCHGGACCRGCYALNHCQYGTHQKLCGTKGDYCKDCGQANCVNGKCQ